MLAYLCAPWESNVRLVANTGYGIAGLAGITFDQVEVRYRKMWGAFVEKTMSVSNWIEKGLGDYVIKWDPEEMDTLGVFIFEVSAPYQDDVVIKEFTVVSPPPSFGIPAPVCVVTGNLVDVGGAPLIGAEVVFRPPHVPYYAGSSLVGAGIIRTVSDAFGNFSARLLRETQVLIEIEQAGIRFCINVPDSPTAQLVDLLPPLPS